MKRVEFGKMCINRVGVPPSPPPLPSRRRPVIAESVTRREIAKYWKLKRMVEEDHFSFAIKAAARLRARNLSEEDYKFFEESLSDEDDDHIQKEWRMCTDLDPNKKDLIRFGIKNWWTKSKYAYLNQPDIKSFDGPKRRRASSYTLQFGYMSAPPQATIFGVC